MSNYDDIWYESNDGLKLYARDYPNSAAKLTLLCMHGLTRNSADFEDLALQLQDQYRIVCVDQRGRGQSEWDSNAANYTPATYVQDMLTLIDFLGLTNVVLVGTSLGGLMSMMMSATKPGLFKGVVLNDVGPVVAQRGLERIKAYVGKAKPVETWDDAIAQTIDANAIAFPKFQRQDWDRWVKRMYEENTEGQLALRYDPAISQPMNEEPENAVPADLWPLFDAMTALPVLTFRGELSDILEPDCTDEMQRRHPGLQVVEVKEVGHAPMLNEPEVLPAMNAFLSGISANQVS